MIGKIIFFVEFPFALRDYERFGIEILKQNEFQVEVWDFTPFINPEVYKNYNVPDTINYEGYHLYLNKDEACLAISKLNNKCFIVCLPYKFNIYSIYKTLSKKSLKYCLITALAVPTPNNNYSTFSNKLLKLKSYFKILFKITPDRLINFLFFRIPYRYLGINPPTLVLAGGQESIDFYMKYHHAPIGPQTEILWIHNFDYDLCLKEKQFSVEVENNLGVFLDQYAPFHPDNYLNKHSYATAEEYYPLLCKFFDYLENKYNIRIVIAAHPHSHYEDHPDYFGERPVIRGKTRELVKKSGFVLVHSSYAINFAVIYKKPIIFITTNQLQQYYEGLYIDCLASIFAKKPINLNDSFEFNWKKELTVNEEAYLSYKNAYIKKSGTEDMPFWQIFANYIKNLSN